MDVVSKILVFGVKYLTEIATQTVFGSYRRNGLNKFNTVLEKRNGDIRDTFTKSSEQVKNHKRKTARGTYNVVDEQFMNIEKEIKDGAISSPQSKDKIAKNIGKLERILKSNHVDYERDRKGIENFKRSKSCPTPKMESIFKEAHANIEVCSYTQEEHNIAEEVYTTEPNKIVKDQFISNSEENDKYKIEMVVQVSKSKKLSENMNDNKIDTDRHLNKIEPKIVKIDEQIESIYKSGVLKPKPSTSKLEEDLNVSQTKILDEGYYTTDNIIEKAIEKSSSSKQKLLADNDYNLGILVRIKRNIKHKQNQSEKPKEANDELHPSFLCDFGNQAKNSIKAATNAVSENTTKFSIITPLAKLRDNIQKSDSSQPSKFTIITPSETLRSLKKWQEKHQKFCKQRLSNSEDGSMNENGGHGKDATDKTKKYIEDCTKVDRNLSKLKANMPQQIRNIDEISSRDYNQYFKEERQSTQDFPDTGMLAYKKLNSDEIYDNKYLLQNEKAQVKSIFQHPRQRFLLEKEGSSRNDIILDSKLIDQKILELRSKKLKKGQISDKPIQILAKQKGEIAQPVSEQHKSQYLLDRVINSLDKALSKTNFKRQTNIETKSIQDLKSYFLTAKKLELSPNDKDDILYRFKPDQFKKYSNTKLSEAKTDHEKEITAILAKMDSDISCMIKNLEQFKPVKKKPSANDLEDKIAKASKYNEEDTPLILKNAEEFKQFETNLFVGKMKSIIANIREQRPQSPRKMMTFEEFENKVLTDKFTEIMDKTKEDTMEILNNFDATKVKELLYEEYLNEKLRVLNQDEHSFQKTEEEFNNQKYPLFSVKLQDFENKLPSNNYDGNQRKPDSTQKMHNLCNENENFENQRKQDSKELMNDLEAFFECERSLEIQDSKDDASSLKEDFQKTLRDKSIEIENIKKQEARNLRLQSHILTKLSPLLKKISQDALLGNKRPEYLSKFENKILNGDFKEIECNRKQELEDIESSRDEEKRKLQQFKDIFLADDFNKNTLNNKASKSKIEELSGKNSFESELNEAQSSLKELPMKYNQIKNEDLNNLKSNPRSNDGLEELKDVFDDKMKSNYALHQLDTTLSSKLFNISKSSNSPKEDPKMNNIEKDISSLLTNKEIFKQAKTKSLPKKLEILDAIKQEHMANVDDPLKKINESDKAKQLAKNKLSCTAFKKIDKYKKELKHKLGAFDKPELSRNQEALINKVQSKLNQLKKLHNKRQMETKNNFNSATGVKQKDQTFNPKAIQAINLVTPKNDTMTRKDYWRNEKQDNLDNKSKSQKQINLKPNILQKSKISFQEADNSLKSSKIKEIDGIKKERPIKKLESPAAERDKFVRTHESKQFSNILDALSKSGLIEIKNKINKPKIPDSTVNQNDGQVESKDIKESKVGQPLNNDIKKCNKLQMPLSKENLSKIQPSIHNSNLLWKKQNQYEVKQDQRNLGKEEGQTKVSNNNLRNFNRALKPLDEFSKVERTLAKANLDSNSEHVDVDANPTLKNKENKYLRSTSDNSLKQVFQTYKYDLSSNHEKQTSSKLDNLLLSKTSVHYKSKLREEIKGIANMIAFANKLKQIENKRREDSKLLLNNSTYFKTFEKSLREKVFNSKFESKEQDASRLHINLAAFSNFQQQIEDKLLKQTIKDLMKQVREDRKTIEKNYETFENVEKKITYKKVEEIEIIRREESKQLVNNVDCFKKFEELLSKRLFNSRLEFIKQDASLLQINLKQFDKAQQNIADNCFKRTINDVTRQVITDAKNLQQNYEAFENFEEMLSKITTAKRLKEIDSNRRLESRYLLNNFDSFKKFEKLLDEKTYIDTMNMKMKQVRSDQKKMEKTYETFEYFEADLKQKELIAGFERIILDSASTYKNDVAFRKLENKIKEESFLKAVAKKRLETLSENSRLLRGNVEQSLLKNVWVSAKPEHKLNEINWDKIDVNNFCRNNSQEIHKEKKLPQLEESRVEVSFVTKVMESFVSLENRLAADVLAENNSPYVLSNKNFIPNLEDRTKITEEDIREKSNLINVNYSVFENTEKIMNMVKIITPNLQTDEANKDNIKERKEDLIDATNTTQEIDTKDYVEKQKEEADLLEVNKSDDNKIKNQKSENNSIERIHSGIIRDTQSLVIKKSLGLNMLVNYLPFGTARQSVINQLEQHYFISNTYVKSNFLTANKFALNGKEIKQVTNQDTFKETPKLIQCTVKSEIKQQEITSNHETFKKSPELIKFGQNESKVKQQETLKEIPKLIQCCTGKSEIKQQEITFNQETFEESPKLIKCCIHTNIMDTPSAKGKQLPFAQKAQKCAKKQEEKVRRTDESIMKQKEMIFNQDHFEECPKESIKVYIHSGIRDIPDLTSYLNEGKILFEKNSRNSEKRALHEQKNFSTVESDISAQLIKNSEELKNKDNIAELISKEFSFKNLENDVNKEVIEELHQLLFGEKLQNLNEVSDNTIKVDTERRRIETGNSITQGIAKLTHSDEVNIKQHSQIDSITNILEEALNRINKQPANNQKHTKKESLPKNVIAEDNIQLKKETDIISKDTTEVGIKENIHQQTEGLGEKYYIRGRKQIIKEHKHETDIISEQTNEFYIKTLNKKYPKTSTPRILAKQIKLPCNQLPKVIKGKLIKTNQPKFEKLKKDSKTIKGKTDNLQLSKRRPLGHNMKIKRVELPTDEDKILKNKDKMQKNRTNINIDTMVDGKYFIRSLSEVPIFEQKMKERNNHANEEIHNNLDKSVMKFQEIPPDQEILRKRPKMIIIHTDIIDIPVPISSPKAKPLLFAHTCTTELEENAPIKDKKETTSNQENSEECRKDLIKVFIHNEHIDSNEPALEVKQILFEKGALLHEPIKYTNDQTMTLTKNEDIGAKLANGEVVNNENENMTNKKYQDTLHTEPIKIKSGENKNSAVISQHDHKDTLKFVNQINIPEVNNEEWCKYKNNIGESISKEFALKDYVNEINKEIIGQLKKSSFGERLFLRKCIKQVTESVTTQKENIVNDNIDKITKCKLGVKDNTAPSENEIETSTKLEELLNSTNIIKQKPIEKGNTALSENEIKTSTKFDELPNTRNINKQEPIKKDNLPKYYIDKGQFPKEYKHETDIISELTKIFAIKSLNKRSAKQPYLESKVNRPKFKNFKEKRTSSKTARNKDKTALDSTNDSDTYKRHNQTKQLSKLRPLGHNMKIGSMRTPEIVTEKDNSNSTSDKTEKDQTSKVPIIDDSSITKKLSKFRPFSHVNIWKTTTTDTELNKEIKPINIQNDTVNILKTTATDMQLNKEIKPSDTINIQNDTVNIWKTTTTDTKLNKEIKPSNTINIQNDTVNIKHNCKQVDSKVQTSCDKNTSDSRYDNDLKTYVDEQILKMRKTKHKNKKKGKQNKKIKLFYFKSHNNMLNTNSIKDLEVALSSYKNKNRKQTLLSETNVKSTHGIVTNTPNLIDDKCLISLKENLESPTEDGTLAKSHAKKLVRKHFKIAVHNEYHIKQKLNHFNGETICKWSREFARDAPIPRNNIKNLEDVIVGHKKMKLIRKNLSISF